MMTKEIKVLVSWSGENYNGGMGDPLLGAVVVAAPSLSEFKKEFEETLSFLIDGLKEENADLPEFVINHNYKIVYDLEATALLKEAENFTTLAAISRASGINQKQLSHYATGIKQPRSASLRKIVEGIHSIGRRALAL